MKVTRERGLIFSGSSLLITLAGLIIFLATGRFAFALATMLVGGTLAWMSIWLVADLIQQNARRNQSGVVSAPEQKSPKQ